MAIAQPQERRQGAEKPASSRARVSSTSPARNIARTRVRIRSCNTLRSRMMAAMRKRQGALTVRASAVRRWDCPSAGRLRGRGSSAGDRGGRCGRQPADPGPGAPCAGSPEWPLRGRRVHPAGGIGWRTLKKAGDQVFR
jgi:hypothetical protein